MLVLDINFRIYPKIIIIDFVKVLDFPFCIFFKFFETKYRNSHVLFLYFGVFSEKTWTLSILHILDRNLGIVLQKRITDNFEGIRLNFLIFYKKIKKIEFACVSFQFWNIFEEDVKIKYFARSRQNSWNCFGKNYNWFFWRYYNSFLGFCNFFEK